MPYNLMNIMPSVVIPVYTLCMNKSIITVIQLVVYNVAMAVASTNHQWCNIDEYNE